MASFAATNITTWVGGYDITGDSNKAALMAEVEPLDSTVFGSVGRARLAGLFTADAEVAGFASYGTTAVDPTMFAGLGGLAPWSMSKDGLEGSPVYSMDGRQLEYSTFGAVGELIPFSATAKSSEGMPPVRGTIMAAKQSVSATGALGTVRQVGAVAAGKYLYAVLHAFSVGTTITVQVQSDDNAGMSSPTTRMTLGPVTAIGGTWGIRVAGPITDDYWRLNVSAITGTSSVAGLIAIQ